MKDVVMGHGTDRNTPTYDYDATMSLLGVLADDPRATTLAEIRNWLAAGADPNGEDGEESVLVRALEQHSHEVIRVLVAAGAYINAADGRDYTPLQRVLSDIPELAALLLELGASPVLSDAHGISPLHVAAETLHHPDAAAIGLSNLRLLLAAGAEADVRTVDGEQPLHRLLALAEPLDDDAEEHAALLRAAVALFAGAGAPLDRPNPMHQLPLTMAAALGLHTVVEELVLQGAPLASEGRENGAALHAATTARAVQILVGAGARVDAVDWLQNTPLHRTPTVAAAVALLEHGADCTARNRQGETPLGVVARRLAKQLLEGTEDSWDAPECQVLGVLYSAGDRELLDAPDASGDRTTTPRAQLRAAVDMGRGDPDVRAYLQAFLARAAALESLAPQSHSRRIGMSVAMV